MTNVQSSIGRESDGGGGGGYGKGKASAAEVEVLRERVTARRRRARKARRESANWVVNRSRRQKVRTLAVCAGALLLMAVGLYFGLARQESTAPVESAAPTGAVGIV
jgi:hypothetical protein